MSTNEEIAVDAQRKFDYFLVGLTFGVLSLAINTFNVHGVAWGRIVELGAWSSLLISGIFGLLRVRIVHMIYSKYAAKQRLDASNAAARKPQDYQEGLKILEKYERNALLWYGISWWTFILGIVTLFIVRAFPVIYSLSQP